MKSYSSSISLPAISKNKKEEMENRRRSLIDAQAPKARPEKPVVFNVKSYKSSENQSSVDWSKLKKNPRIKLPIEKPQFVKIDYMRVKDRKEAI